MNSITLSTFEAAACDWLTNTDFAFDARLKRLDGGALAIDYWHAPYQCYGLLIVTDRLTEADLLTLITRAEFHITARQQRDYDAAVAGGTPKHLAHDAAFGFPTRAQVCVQGDALDEAGREAYQRASGTFDEPLVIGVWVGVEWVFEFDAESADDA